jgi:hypothetical protein
MAPPPGSTPSSEPSVVPRSTAGQERRKSSRVGQSRAMFWDRMARFSSARDRLAMISATPKRPIASVATSIPSLNSVMPKVKRVPPVWPSVPTSPTRSPRTIIATALITEPCASTTAAIRPNNMSEKYSGAPKD